MQKKSKGVGKIVNIRNLKVSKYPNKDRLMFVTGETFRNLIKGDIEEQFNIIYKKFGWQR